MKAARKSRGIWSCEFISGVVAVAGCVGGAACPAWGDLAYLTQDRKAHAWGYNSQSVFKDETLAAPDFEPFYHKFSGFGIAEHDSALETDGLHFFAKTAGSHGGNAKFTAGECMMNTTFEVDKPTRFHLHGLMTKAFYDDGSNATDSFVKVSLTGSSVQLQFIANNSEDEVPIEAWGWMYPGQPYTFQSHVKAKGQTSPMSCCKSRSLDVTLEVVCYADCDESGMLEVDDFICFQTLFALGDMLADCDGSGSLTIDDFICFQTTFSLGC